MDATALEARLARLEQEMAELRRENQSLRAPVPEPKQDATEGQALPRRDLFKGAAYALGAVSLSLMGTRPAEAVTGTMRYGTINDAGNSLTELASEHPRSTLDVFNNSLSDHCVALRAVSETGGAFFALVETSSSIGHGVTTQADGRGHALFAVKKSEIGNCVAAHHSSATSIYAAIGGVTSGAGAGVNGSSSGSGNGVRGELFDAAQTQSAILGTTEGTGPAIEGNSILGRGGVFRGKKAQVRLVASAATTKPSKGSRGDLFVDSSGRLWYCKTGNSLTGWKQLA